MTPQIQDDDTRVSFLDDFDEDAETDGGDTADTVAERIFDELDHEAIHSINVVAQRGDTHYCVVARSQQRNGGPVVDLRTVVVDLDQDTVKAADNGLWIPRDANALDGLTRGVARTTTDVADSDDTRDADPLVTSIPGVDAQDLLNTEVGADEHTRDWGAGDGPPPEVDTMVERLNDAGVDTTERFNRLDFGQKTPWDHDLRPREELLGNYGVYATEDDPLVLIDVDYPEDAPKMPETFAVSSPHGSDERAHHFYVVEDYDRLKDVDDGTLNWGPTWGEIRTANQYVVGPGSQLDAEGCDLGDHEVDDPSGCDDCKDPEGGRYEIVADHEIATVSADWVLDLLDDDPDVDLTLDDHDNEDTDADEQGAPEDIDPVEAGRNLATPGDSDPGDAGADGERVECYRCESMIPRSEAVEFASDGDTTVYVHRGGCE